MFKPCPPEKTDGGDRGKRGGPPAPYSMPGRWVGGRGSIAAPTKGTYIEAEVFDDTGAQQGTVLLYVKILFAPGEAGRTFHGDLVTATDSYYRHWLTLPAGAVTTVDGAYHLCKGKPSECKGGAKAEYMVHLGKWRQWKEPEMLDESQTDFVGPAKALMMTYLKGARATLEEKGELPWDQGAANKAGGLRIDREKSDGRGKTPGKPKEREEHEEPKKPKGARKEKIASLEAELERLKKEAAAADDESSEEEKEPRKKAMKKAEEPSGKEIFKGSVLGGRSRGKDEEKERDSSSSNGDTSSPDMKVREKEPKKAEKANKEDAAKERGSKRKKGSKKLKKRRKKKAKDKGPFGLEATEEGSSESSIDDTTDSSDESFRKAPAGLTLFLRLQRYAQRHPGRLAARLLRKMKASGRYPVGALAKKVSEVNLVEPAALAYYQAVMVPNMKDVWTPRTQREIKYMAILLDLLAESKASQAADIVAQRLKALEKSVIDRNQWKRAKYLELVEPEEGLLADRGEEQLMQKELEREERLRSPTRGNDRARWKGKGDNQDWSKGKQKGDRKGKNKGKTPTEAAIEAKKKE